MEVLYHLLIEVGYLNSMAQMINIDHRRVLWVLDEMSDDSNDLEENINH